MPRPPHARPPAFDRARPELVRPVRIDPTGKRGPTTAQARGRHWRRTSQGYYVPSYVDGSLPEQRIVEAGHHLDGMASVTGWAALRWMGAEWFDGRSHARAEQLPVDVAVVHGAHRSQDGIHVTSEFIPPRDRIVVDGLAVTVPVCAVAYLMRYADDVRASARALGMAAAADLVSIAEAREFAELLYHWIGIPQMREGIELADENWWSPREADLHLLWRLDAGLGQALANQPIFDRAGRHVGTPDLLDAEAGVVGEYEGAVHLTGTRRTKDLRRLDAFAGLQLECFTVVAGSSPDTVVRRMRAARERARSLSPDERPWTIDPPAWWVRTHTVALRRALTGRQQERFLGYRRTA